MRNDLSWVEKHKLKPIYKRLAAVNAFKESMAQLSDEDLQAKTAEFKSRYQQGESLDDLLPEAFAAMREANKRVLGMFPYDVQVLGAIVLHQGNVAEMKTGEGKTLTATMPLYLNALTGESCLLVTVNNYLAMRDAEEMGEVYRFMGMTSSIALPKIPTEQLKAAEKRRLYAADIVYTTNAALGFDYLLENLAFKKSDQFLRPFNYVIIDEVDSVLLEHALNPLIISGSPRVQSNLYNMANQFVLTLVEDEDYQVDRDKEAVWLTRKGILRAESYFRVGNLFAGDTHELNRHIILALRAHVLFKKNKNYVVQDDEVKLLSMDTGRIQEGTRLQSGIHQALDAKEKVKISTDNRAMGSITFQSLFRMFNKIAGMTGTVRVAAKELYDTYGIGVYAIPTNNPIQRIDLPDKVYPTLQAKVEASMAFIREKHEAGQPLLIVTGSVGMSNLYSALLLREGIAHSVLNALSEAKEAMIIKEAGRLGAVTIATSMAGRGTDIKLSDEVKQLGGLVVVGTERMPTSRIDWQMRGRSGRQGDPGLSQFFISLEDELVAKWGSKSLLKESQRQRKRLSRHKKQWLVREFNKAQRLSETQAVEMREMSLQFDESLRLQRDLIYKDRKALINSQIDIQNGMISLAETVLTRWIKQVEPNNKALLHLIADKLSYETHQVPDTLNIKQTKEVVAWLLTIFKERLATHQSRAGSQKDYNDYLKLCVLKVIDEQWIEQVDYLNQFRMVVMSRQSAQKVPLYEFQQEAVESFERMKLRVDEEIIRFVSLSEIMYDKSGEIYVQFA